MLPDDLNTNGTILVSYASYFGSTGEVAQAIAKTLTMRGYKVTIKPLGAVEDVSLYDGVIIGSAIQYDKWMPEATDFVSANQVKLSKMKVGFFFTCLTLAVKSEKAQLQAKRYANVIHDKLPQVDANDIGRFAGVLDFKKLSFFPRQLAKIMFAYFGVDEGDHRDWKAIDNWANGLKLTNIPQKTTKLAA